MPGQRVLGGGPPRHTGGDEGGGASSHGHHGGADQQGPGELQGLPQLSQRYQFDPRHNCHLPSQPPPLHASSARPSESSVSRPAGPLIPQWRLILKSQFNLFFLLLTRSDTLPPVSLLAFFFFFFFSKTAVRRLWIGVAAVGLLLYRAVSCARHLYVGLIV